MLARLPTHLTMLVLGGLAGVLVALFAAPAYAPPNGAPVQIIDAENKDQVARVTQDGAVRVTGDVQVSGAATIDGSVEVSNLPENQDVTVTNTAVRVRPARDSGQVTPNTLDFDVPAGTTETFPGSTGGFQGVDAFFVQVTGADEDVTVVFTGGSNDGKMILRGEGESGIGQEDYAISLPQPIRVDEISVTCDETSGSCRLFVQVVGTF